MQRPNARAHGHTPGPVCFRFRANGGKCSAGDRATCIATCPTLGDLSFLCALTLFAFRLGFAASLFAFSCFLSRIVNVLCRGVRGRFSLGVSEGASLQRVTARCSGLCSLWGCATFSGCWGLGGYPYPDLIVVDVRLRVKFFWSCFRSCNTSGRLPVEFLAVLAVCSRSAATLLRTGRRLQEWCSGRGLLRRVCAHGLRVRVRLQRQRHR